VKVRGFETLKECRSLSQKILSICGMAMMRISRCKSAVLSIRSDKVNHFSSKVKGFAVNVDRFIPVNKSECVSERVRNKNPSHRKTRDLMQI
jgi:hypothetical protein